MVCTLGGLLELADNGTDLLDDRWLLRVGVAVQTRRAPMVTVFLRTMSRQWESCAARILMPGLRRSAEVARPVGRGEIDNAIQTHRTIVQRIKHVPVVILTLHIFFPFIHHGFATPPR